MRKTIISALFFIFLFLAVTFILFFFYQDKLIFFPVKLYHPYGYAKQYEPYEITIHHKSVMLHGWYLNPGRSKLILYYGGNAEEVSGNLEDFQKRTDYSVLLLNYRGFGKSSGSPSQKNLFDDALFVYDYIMKQSKTPIQEVILFGRSLGSGIATYVASKRPIDSMILVTPFDSIRNVAKKLFPVLPIDWLLKHPFNSLRHIEQVTIDTLVLVAEKDKIIPYESTKNLIDHMESNCRSVVIKGAGHNDIHLFPTYWAEIMDFLEQ